MLQQMCGFEAVDRVVLLTTMWDQVDPGTIQHDIACQRQQELIWDSRFWGEMCRRGSRVMQFDGSKRSASQAVDALSNRHIRNGPTMFQIQREVVDEGKDIRVSSAARELVGELIRIREQSQNEIGQLLEQHKQAEKERDHEKASKISQETYALEKGLKDVTAANHQLQTCFKDICTQKEARFTDIFRHISQEYETLTKELRSQKSRLQSLEEEQQESIAIYESEREGTLSRPHVPSLPPAYDESFESSYRQDQDKIQEETTEIKRSLKVKKAKRMMIQNIIPMLQILGGAGCVAGGVVSMMPPLTAAGATLIATGASRLDFSMRRKQSRHSEECGD